jgi:hypothetical protein
VIVTSMSTYVRRGDLAPDLVYYARDDSHDADLTAVESWRLIGVFGNQPLFIDTNPTVDVPNPAEPWQVTLTHEWAPAETAKVGRINVEAEAMWPGGKPQTFPGVAVDVKQDLG